MPDEVDDLLPLLEAVRADDERTARALVERLHPLVPRIVRAHRPRRVAEEDLCRGVLRTVFANIGQYRAVVSFECRVSHVAVNTELRWTDLSEAESAVVNDILSHETTTKDTARHANEILMRLIDALAPRDQSHVDLTGTQMAISRQALMRKQNLF
jgi:RNA polymerase sigma-70 factor, ECF subfamily